MKKLAILQSNYIPWKGYFDLINMVDEFVFYDDMQYTRRDWRNRNKIKTSQGLKWLSIPVEVKGKYFQKINETLVSDKSWSVTHWQTIKQFYSKTPFFKDYKDIFEEFYMNNQEEHLSLINARLIELVNSILGIQTKITWSSDYELVQGQTEKLLGICQQAGADVYLSGPAAKDYFDEALAEKMGIKVEWMDYSGYPEYHQLHPPFEHGVTILDLIFNEGPNAKNFMKSFK
ncbi:MAG: WbqC family protein [Campylobacterales bacterium]|nr:WbqC family protein [Campylobacterales bacterium]